MSRLRERTDTKLYYSISEASAIAKVKPHVLRYWETQFKMLRPKKNKAGNRMYRKRDLKLIQLIKELLYDKGYTISGARRKLLDDRAALRDQIEIKFTDVERLSLLNEIIRDLKDVLDDLKQPPGEVARRSRAEEVAATARDAAAGAGSGGNGGNGAGHADTMTDSNADVSAESDDDSGQDTAPEPKILGA